MNFFFFFDNAYMNEIFGNAYMMYVFFFFFRKEIGNSYMNA